MIRSANLILPLIAFCFAAVADEIKIFKSDVNTYRFSQASIHQRTINGGHLKVLEFTINRSSLSEVQDALGSAEILPRKEHAANKICYSSARPGDGTSIIFAAGAMGGWKELTSIEIISGDTNFLLRHRCTKSGQINKVVGTAGGLNLGFSKEELWAKLGKPTSEVDGNILYFYKTKQRMTSKELEHFVNKNPSAADNPYFDVLSHVEAEFSGGVLTRLVIGKTVSY